MIVRLLGVLLMIYGAWMVWWAVATWSLLSGLWCVYLLACGFGLVLHARWGAWLWYGLVALAAGGWLWSVAAGALRAGRSMGDATTAGLSVLPGLVLLLLLGLASIAVATQYRHFREAPPADR